jgi:hypothetical protein
MSNYTRDDRWRELCKAIMREPDPGKLLHLVEKLNQALQQRENDLKHGKFKDRNHSEKSGAGLEVRVPFRTTS